MVQSAPPPKVVFPEVNEFVSKSALVAHNASFDRSFWNFERSRLGQSGETRFLCTMLMARRLYPWSHNHKLATLASVHRLPSSGRHHRALADASVTAHLLLRILTDLDELYPEQQIDSQFLARYQKRRKIDARSKPMQRRRTNAAQVSQTSSGTRIPVARSNQATSQTQNDERSWATPHVKMESMTQRSATRNPNAERPEKSHSRRETNWSWLWWLIAAAALFILFG